jgi:hypothetical protein
MRDMSASGPMHVPFLTWRGGLYAKAGGFISLFCILLFALHRPVGPANGGTTLGYFLGVLAAGLVFWLAWFGVRRRRYERAGALEGVLSAHVYLGLTVLVVAGLHAGFRFHGNVHTLAFLLLFLVVASGIFGTFAFWRYPERMTRNRDGATLTTMTAELAAVDTRCRQLALAFPDDILALIRELVSQGASRKRYRQHSLAVISRVQDEFAIRHGVGQADVLKLVRGLTDRMVLLQRLHRDRHYRARLLLWRAVHVPLTVGLLVALCLHVLVVFYDW